RNCQWAAAAGIETAACPRVFQHLLKLVSLYDEIMRSGKRTGRASEADAAKDRQRGPRDERGVLADQILKAARASFASRGYGATSLRSVAHDAGVDPALVSYYFESKAGLLDAVLVLPDGFLEGITAAA